MLTDHALRKKLGRAMAQAIHDFSMIEDGDRILCAVSGGKDSYVLHQLLFDLSRRAPIRFEVIALNVDQGHPGFPAHVIPGYMRAHGYPYRVIAEDTYSVVKAKVPEGKTTCSLCSRLRRGILYSAAREMGANKIALGHHRDDAITTLMLNLLFGGTLKAMPARLVCDEGDIMVLRPLIYCAEDDIAAYAEAQGFPIIPCTLCGSQPNQQRRVVSELLAQLDAAHPGVRASMLGALGNVRPSHLLDARLAALVAPAVDDDEPESEKPLVQLRRGA